MSMIEVTRAILREDLNSPITLALGILRTKESAAICYECNEYGDGDGIETVASWIEDARPLLLEGEALELRLVTIGAAEILARSVPCIAREPGRVQ